MHGADSQPISQIRRRAAMLFCMPFDCRLPPRFASYRMPEINGQTSAFSRTFQHLQYRLQAGSHDFHFAIR
jgi:hypothetical protein